MASIVPPAALIAAQVIAAIYAVGAWPWPRKVGLATGAGFLVAGAFNVWTACHSPELYVQGFGPHALPPYCGFIYGIFARHTPYSLSP